ncbi:MAG: CoA transferase [Proteobacteria bacterium]|nr:CoA transferase [Pseudomonadota bacterium]
MLQRIKVLDFSRVLSGPFCSRMLADLGAEIIKVESKGGDPMRGAFPHKGGFSSYFTQFNLGKQSISVNLHEEKGIALIKKLAAKCDVILENFRPGRMAEIGLDYDTLKEINPRIVFCSISGFGQTGEESKRPAYTDIVQAYSGLDYAAGEMYGSSGSPPGFPFSLGDTYASLNATIAILTALYHREATGEGQFIDISMLDCIMAANDSTVQKYIFSDGQDDIPSLVFRPPFKMKDGYMAASVALNFEKTIQAIERPDLLEDESFKDPDTRRNFFDVYIEIVKEWAETKTVAEASAIFDKFDIPYAKVQSTAEIVNSPVVQRRKMLVDMELPESGKVPVVNTPFRFSGSATGPQGPPPRLGEDSRKVLESLLGLNKDEIDELRKQEIIY